MNNSDKNNKFLFHYTNIKTLKYIIKDQTFKLNSLKNVNDKLEVARKGIEDKVANVFVGCFSHNSHEIVPFWYNYGGKTLKNKILLKFKQLNQEDFYSNFAFCNIKNLDHENKKIAFYEYQTKNFSQICKDNNFLKTWILMNHPNKTYLEFKNIKYIPSKSEYFERNFSNSDGNRNIFDLSDVGLKKTLPWDYEKEQRIICKINMDKTYDETKIESILLRVKKSFFEKLETIILNPWTNYNDNTCNKIIKLTENYKIKIEESELLNQIKIEESEL